jgi:hypothetical protein
MVRRAVAATKRFYASIFGSDARKGKPVTDCARKHPDELDRAAGERRVNRRNHVGSAYPGSLWALRSLLGGRSKARRLPLAFLISSAPVRKVRLFKLFVQA